MEGAGTNSPPPEDEEVEEEEEELLAIMADEGRSLAEDGGELVVVVVVGEEVEVVGGCAGEAAAWWLLAAAAAAVAVVAVSAWPPTPGKATPPPYSHDTGTKLWPPSCCMSACWYAALLVGWYTGIPDLSPAGRLYGTTLPGKACNIILLSIKVHLHALTTLLYSGSETLGL